MKTTAQIVERGIDLLSLCQKLQSDVDGISRPDIFSVDKSKELDQFAMDINETALYLGMLLKLIPMQEKLSEIGKKLENSGQIKMNIGDSFAEAALGFFEAQVSK